MEDTARIEQETRNGAAGVAAGLVDAVKGLRETLFVLGVVLYGAARLAYDGFYGKLGVSAGEVGVTYAEVINRAALGLALFGALLVALVAIALLFIGLIRPSTSAVTPASDIGWALTGSGLVLSLSARCRATRSAPPCGSSIERYEPLPSIVGVLVAVGAGWGASLLARPH